MQHFNKWFTKTFRKPSIWLISCESIQNTQITGMAYHSPSIHFSTYMRLFQPFWSMVYSFRALMNMERNNKMGGERGREGNSHLAFLPLGQTSQHTVNGTTAAVSLWDPEMKGNICSPCQTFPLSLTDANKKLHGYLRACPAAESV